MRLTNELVETNAAGIWKVSNNTNVRVSGVYSKDNNGAALKIFGDFDQVNSFVDACIKEDCIFGRTDKFRNIILTGIVRSEGPSREIKSEYSTAKLHINYVFSGSRQTDPNAQRFDSIFSRYDDLKTVVYPTMIEHVGEHNFLGVEEIRLHKKKIICEFEIPDISARLHISFVGHRSIGRHETTFESYPVVKLKFLDHPARLKKARNSFFKVETIFRCLLGKYVMKQHSETLGIDNESTQHLRIIHELANSPANRIEIGPYDTAFHPDDIDAFLAGLNSMLQSLNKYDEPRYDFARSLIDEEYYSLERIALVCRALEGFLRIEHSMNTFSAALKLLKNDEFYKDICAEFADYDTLTDYAVQLRNYWAHGGQKFKPKNIIFDQLPEITEMLTALCHAIQLRINKVEVGFAYKGVERRRWFDPRTVQLQ